MNGVRQTEASNNEKRSELTLQQIIAPVWAKRNRIVVISIIAGVLTLIINFLLPNFYKSTAVLLPENDKGKLGSFSQFAGLASLAGVNVSGGEVSRLYPTIVTSETVLRSVIEKEYQTPGFSRPVNLIRYFELEEPTPEKNFDKALKTLKESMSASLDNKTNTVTITLEMREPQLAADVLNATIAELDKFMRLKKITNASEQRKWIDDRLRQVEQELRNAEEALKNFREKNRRVVDSPQLILEQERLLREVQVKSTIFVELKKQSELAKIEEIKNISIVNVLDEARPPVRKERPKRATNAAIMFVVVLISVSGYYAVRPLYGDKIMAFVNSIRHERTQAEG